MCQSDNIQVIARAVIVSDKGVLLARFREKNYSFLPGGHVEWGESVLHALKRELLEETALQVTVGELLAVVENAWVDDLRTHHEVNVVFAAQFDQLPVPAEIESPEENLCFSWCPVENVINANLLPSPLVQIVLGSVDASQKFRFASAMPKVHSSD